VLPDRIVELAGRLLGEDQQQVADQGLPVVRERLADLLDVAAKPLDRVGDEILGDPAPLQVVVAQVRRHDLAGHDGRDGDRDQRGEREREREPAAQLHDLALNQ